MVGEKLALTCVQMSTKVNASHGKSTQVYPGRDQTETQVDTSFQLAFRSF